MARRKSSKRGQVKKLARPKLETSFSCPYCNEDNAVECKIDRSKQTGSASCRVCHAGYQTIVNCTMVFSAATSYSPSWMYVDLTDPVDIFAEWIDAIDAQAKQREARRQRTAAAKTSEVPRRGADKQSQSRSSMEEEGRADGELERATFTEVSD